MYYQQALNHLKKDVPNLDIEKKISELNELIKKINENTNELYTEIHNVIDIEFRKDKTVSSAGKYGINESYVKSQVILKCWERYYNSLDHPSNKSILRLRNYFPNCKCFLNNNKLYFSIEGNSNVPVVHNNELAPDIFLEKVNHIIINTNVTKMLKDLCLLQNKLKYLINEIKQSVNAIPSSIDNKDYRTNAKCCPGMFTLMFNYLK